MDTTNAASKHCPRCGEVKPLAKFHRNRCRKDGRSVYCAECTRLYNNTYYAGKAHDYLSARNYGLPRGEYLRMLEEQDCLCAICREPETIRLFGQVKRLAVDHAHDTGQVRALLCHGCNAVLGYSRDDPKLLRAAADYLERDWPDRNRQQPLEPARVAKCGTYSGYSAHYHRRETPCESCKEARREYNRNRATT